MDIMRQCMRDRSLWTLVDAATLWIIDGAPVEWAGELAVRPVVGRCPAPRCRGYSRRGRAPRPSGAALGRSHRSRRAGRRGAAPDLPELRVSHHFPPFGFEEQPAEWDAIRRSIAETQASIVFAGLGFPKQERVIESLRRDFPGVWFIGCGAAIDFAAGMVPRAPEWMQRAGLAWSYRIITEPRRLAKRYTADVDLRR